MSDRDARRAQRAVDVCEHTGGQRSECDHCAALDALVGCEAERDTLRVEVERLTRAAAWLPDGIAPELTEEHLRGIKIRWATGPMDNQSDADALIGAVERLTRERDEARKRYADLCIGDPHSGDAYVPPAPAAVTLNLRNERDALRAEVKRLGGERDAAQLETSALRWGPLLDAEEANDLLRGQRDRLRALVARLAASGPPKTARDIEEIYADTLRPGDMAPLRPGEKSGGDRG